MARQGIKLAITTLTLIVLIMFAAYKIYQPPAPIEEPAPPPPPPPPSPPTTTQTQTPAPPVQQEEPPASNTTYTPQETRGQKTVLEHARNLARITATITKPTEAGGAAQEEDVVTSGRPTLNVDIGFVKSVKPILLEREISGRVVDVQLVDINGYCVKCGLLIEVDTGDGVEYVLAMGSWEAEDRIIATVNLLLYIQPGDRIVVEALRNSYEYKGNPLYIAYEIKIPGKGVELERVAYEHIHDDW